MAIGGRSNVGKSSLLNALVGRRGLARTSATPGRTRQINFFALDDRLVLADLPGYGFAVGPDAERAAWGPLVEGYLATRPSLRGMALLLDVRRPVAAEERDVLAFLAAHRLPAALVATKIDKLGRSAAREAVARLAEELRDVPVIGFSTRTGEGRDALWRLIRAWASAPPRPAP